LEKVMSGWRGKMADSVPAAKQQETLAKTEQKSRDVEHDRVAKPWAYIVYKHL